MLLLSYVSLFAQTPSSPVIISLPPTFLKLASGGVMVHLDPQTGKYVNAVAAGAVVLTLSPQDVKAMSTSSDGLQLVAGDLPGSGVIVDLQGRFQSPVVTVIDADGIAHVHHLQPLPASVTGAQQ
jgi:hypothetical protein